MQTQIRLHVETREPFAGGIDFGDVGPYERLSGRVTFAVDPDAPSYREVMDIGNTPRNGDGYVTYTTDWYLLKPLDVTRGNRRLVFDVANRGNKRLLQFFNDAVHSNTPHSAAHAGNGFLMRRGYTVVWCGWQGDILPGDGRLTMSLPMAMADGAPATGRVRSEFIADEAGLVSLPLSSNTYTRSYAAAQLDTDQATLTCREYAWDERQVIAPTAWQFARLDDAGQVQPSPADCYLPEGFKTGWIYELIYTARAPELLGLGFTAVRDWVSFLRYASTDADGTSNPLRQGEVGIDRAYAWGRSQSGRFLREFVYRGWNREAQGRRTFDAVWPHVTGAGRLAMNYRFAQPDRYPRQHEQHLYPSDQFPFAYATSTDPWQGQTDAILKRPETDPLVIHTQTASEYWQRRGSLVHTDAMGQDLPEHPQARIFLFASSQHFADPRGEAAAGIHQQLSNPLNTSPLLRALLDALDGWASHDTPPPPSRIPTREADSLIPVSRLRTRFPSLPHVHCPEAANRLFVQNFGPSFAQGHLTQEPPQEYLEQEYAVLVPSVDSDGNDLAGIHTPHVTVPLATFTGWNLRREDFGARAMMSVIGSYIPFARDETERQVQGDPRPAIAERYRSRVDYIRRLAIAAQQLVEDRLLLEEDADRYIEMALQETAFGVFST